MKPYSKCSVITDCGTCTKTPVPMTDGKTNCTWSSKYKKCGSFEGDTYGTTCNATFVDELAAYGESMKYAGKNVQTLDGKRVYVTKSGVAKLYESPATFNSNAGYLGCPTDVANVNQNWDKLGFPTGSVMAKGQTCGNETKYVTAEPPENNFDAKWYRKNYSELRLETDEDAKNDWNTEGKAAGRLPNPDILKSMTTLGKVGYVDPNTVLHNIKDFAYAGLKAFVQRSNVIGTKMADCSAMVDLKYGDRVTLIFDDKTGFLDSDSNLTFGDQKHVFIVRPPPYTYLNRQVVKYGDMISLAASVSNYTERCGYWGCQVGTVDGSTWNYSFGPGGITGGTQLELIPPSGYVVGDNVAYNTPLTISTEVAEPINSLYQGDEMDPGGEPLPSNDGEFFLTYRTDGIVAFYQQPDTEIWKCEKPAKRDDDTLIVPKVLRINSRGSLEALDQDSIPYWSTETTGTGPFKLAVQSDGRLVLYDGTMNELWGVGESVPGADSTYIATLDAGVNDQLQLVFTDEPSGQKMFSFRNSDATNVTVGAKCDLKTMQSQCGAGCIGFIHDGNANEWQRITPGAKTTDFRITDTKQDIYVKAPYVSPKDKTCAKDNALFIDDRAFSNYVGGEDFSTSGSNQCGPTDKSLTEAEERYRAAHDARWREVQKDAEDFDGSALSELQNTATTYMQRNQNTMSELQRNLKKIKNKPKNVTFEQQTKDSAIVEKQGKARAIFWAILAVMFAGFVVVALYGGVRGVIYFVGVLVVLYLGYRFFH